MNENTRTKRIAAAAMFAALTLLATFVLKIPTPTFGYVHIGDTFVILSGIILGPWLGALAAGLGAGLADLLGGFAVWAPGTFVIKFLTALTAAFVYRALIRRKSGKKAAVAVILCAVAGEIVMVIGYFFYNVLIVALTNGSFSHVSIMSAFTLSFTEIPFNLVQGAIGVVLGTALAPVFKRLGSSMIGGADS